MYCRMLVNATHTPPFLANIPAEKLAYDNKPLQTIYQYMRLVAFTWIYEYFFAYFLVKGLCVLNFNWSSMFLCEKKNKKKL